MELGPNSAPPETMHVDMNSCFATCEQQANPLLRVRPVAVAAYTTPNGCIVSPSYEAKAQGVRVGMAVREGKLLCPDLYVMAPNPPLYRHMHMEMRKIFADYSPDVLFPSIDEGIISFKGTPALRRGLENVGHEIKDRFRNELGTWMRCNVGIGPNRFWAKTAAGLHKPDGMDTVTSRNKVRLNLAGIHSPRSSSTPRPIRSRGAFSRA